MNRRDAIQIIGIGVPSTVILGAEIGCGPNIDTELAIGQQILGIISSTATGLGLTGAVALIDKAVAVYADVQKAYHDGKFTSALDILNELVAPGGLFDQVLADAGVATNNKIKALMLTLNGALRVVIVILGAHKNDPVVVNARKLLSPATEAKIQNVLKLADEKAIDAGLNALRFK